MNEKLVAEIENLKIDNKSNKPSSSLLNKMPGGCEQVGNLQNGKSREQIKMERRARVAEAKTKKIVTEEKRALKQNKMLANEGKTTGKTVNWERKCSPSNITDQQCNPLCKTMKDPGLPSGFRSSQPFRVVHFDVKTMDEVDEDEEGPSKQPSVCEMVTPSIHPSFLDFVTRCEAKRIIGVDAVCVAFVQSFKQFLLDYVVSPNQVMSRDLEQAFRRQLNYMTENGKHSFPLVLRNLIKQLKKEIIQLSDTVSEQEGRKRLYYWLDDFVQQNFELALQTISLFCLRKMKSAVFVLTYSWCPVVERIILDAYNNNLFFHVHVLDSPIECKGRQLVKTLCQQKIPCSYGLLSSVGYLMKECHMVLLGCSAILSNGFIVGERGSSQIALVASASNIPVLVAAQTCKFVDRVQSFSHGIHEVNDLMGERKEVIASDLITAIVTELRILPPSSAPAVLKAKQLAFDS